MYKTINELAPEHINAVLNPNEKVFLANLVKGLDASSIIVEVGSWMMGSACIFADANPQAEIHCFDPFYDKDNEDTPPYMLDQISRLCNGARSLESCTALVGNRTNITLHQGLSPESCKDWTTPVDFYFEDGSHTDPTLINNLNFWLPKVKVGGYFAMHDYGDYIHLFYELKKENVNKSNDVRKHVHELLASRCWELVAQPDITIILKKIR